LKIPNYSTLSLVKEDHRKITAYKLDRKRQAVGKELGTTAIQINEWRGMALLRHSLLVMD
jgi:hypothetical protein